MSHRKKIRKAYIQYLKENGKERIVYRVGQIPEGMPNH